MKKWEEFDYKKFLELKKYIPDYWVDKDSFMKEYEEDSMYVYKPNVLGHGGNGIIFNKGRYLLNVVENSDKKDWVIQKFINPFIFRERKTHFRSMTLFIAQPDGTREVYVYNKIRILLAGKVFDKNDLYQKENSHMLVTNMMHNQVLFELDPLNKGKVFDPSTCVLDASTELGKDGNMSYTDVYKKIRTMQKKVFSILGNLIECKETDTSIWNNSCYHIMASDIAFDTEGNAFLLEMNVSQGLNVLWTKEEQIDFLRSAGSLIRGTQSPYRKQKNIAWSKII